MSLIAELQSWSDWALAKGDVRVRDWPLMNPLHVIYIVAAYFLIVGSLVFIMKRREKPLNLKYVAIAHNLHLTLLSLYMFVEVIRQSFLHGYSWFGNDLDRSEKGLGMANVLWIFYISKIAEFVDTFIMALKKNFHQISFLHLYHHSSIFAIWWVIVYYAPGGESYFSAALNSFIHVVMYGYYFWSTITPKSVDPTRRPTPFEPAYYRRYITSMQLLQFCSMMVQAVIDLIFPPNNYPVFCIWILFIYMITMLMLFGNFYKKAYVAKAKSAKTQ